MDDKHRVEYTCSECFRTWETFGLEDATTICYECRRDRKKKKTSLKVAPPTEVEKDPTHAKLIDALLVAQHERSVALVKVNDARLRYNDTKREHQAAIEVMHNAETENRRARSAVRVAQNALKSYIVKI